VPVEGGDESSMKKEWLPGVIDVLCIISRGWREIALVTCPGGTRGCGMEKIRVVIEIMYS
jgi:hypothetical protein